MKKNKMIIIASAVIIMILYTGFVVASGVGSTASIKFLPGDLSITEVTDIAFVSRIISYGGDTYPAQASSIILEISDLRGTGDGWEVVATADQFTTVEEIPKESLNGAAIILLNGTPHSSVSMDNAPTVNQEITLECDSDSSQMVALAEKDKGLGVWEVRWTGTAGDNTSVGLRVPPQVATVGTHTTTITWAFKVAP